MTISTNHFGSIRRTRRLSSLRNNKKDHEPTSFHCQTRRAPLGLRRACNGNGHLSCPVRRGQVILGGRVSSLVTSKLELDPDSQPPPLDLSGLSFPRHILQPSPISKLRAQPNDRITLRARRSSRSAAGCDCCWPFVVFSVSTLSPSRFKYHVPAPQSIDHFSLCGLYWPLGGSHWLASWLVPFLITCVLCSIVL